MHKWLFTIFIVFLLSGCVTGCKSVELENKEFPVTLGLDVKDNKFQVIYNLPNLTKATEQKEEQNKEEISEIQVKNLQSAQEEYLRGTDKQLDYSHLKAIVISRQLLENKELLESLLEYFEEHNEVSQSVLVFASESPKEVIEKGSKKDGGLGIYLEKLLSNLEKGEQKLTMGKLIAHWRNQNETLILPILEAEGKMDIRMGRGLLLEYANVLGELQEEEKKILQLSKAEYIDKVYYIKGKPEVTVKKARVSYKIKEKASIPVVSVKVTLIGETKQNKIEKETKIQEVKEIIASQIQEELETLEKKWRQEKNIDLWNTFTMLGTKNRELWKKYRNDQDRYKKDREIYFTVEWSNI